MLRYQGGSRTSYHATKPAKAVEAIGIEPLAEVSLTPPMPHPDRSLQMTEKTLIDYYAKRAGEYERVYHKPERQHDLHRLKEHLKGELRDRRVLEVACGTGYWTAAIAEVAHSITASDINEEVLTLARAKNLPSARITFEILDAYSPNLQGDFDAGLACFWWSHIPLSRLSGFLGAFHSSLLPGARVTFVDNQFVPGSSTPISKTDTEGNTYQSRHLSDGSGHEVLKNFPTSAFLRSILSAYADSITITEFDYFWSVSYHLSQANQAVEATPL